MSTVTQFDGRWVGQAVQEYRSDWGYCPNNISLDITIVDGRLSGEADVRSWGRWTISGAVNRSGKFQDVVAVGRYIGNIKATLSEDTGKGELSIDAYYTCEEIFVVRLKKIE